MQMRYTTRGDQSSDGKLRVFFTCHPEDLGRCYLRICTDLLDATDCAVFSTWDLTAPISPEDLPVDIGSCHILVVPVTLRLLTQPNRAMDADIPYARREHIPILPIMMETGLEGLYCRTENFGDLQYLCPIANDDTQIDYKIKLQKHLESVFTDDVQIRKIREEFAAYIFLSYRKKDRRYANEVMRRIHRNAQYRDVAIWYDEFLTPGENFQKNISQALEKCRLFTLVVTPNLLEEPEGKANYVMSTEYPNAQKMGKYILPIEMEQTDRELLLEKYGGIPEVIKIGDDEQYKCRLAEALGADHVFCDDTDPMHLYRIGLAYLLGVDMEIDRRKGMELITAAAERGVPNAMDRLFNMYYYGSGVARDCHKAAYWAERLVKFFLETEGLEHVHTLSCMNNLSAAYGALGKNDASLQVQEQVYPITCKLLGEEDEQSLTALNNLAVAYAETYRHREALPLYEKAYSIARRKYGEGHMLTLNTMINLAYTYNELKRYQESNDLNNKAYDCACKALGQFHSRTLTIMNNQAICYFDMGRKEEGIKLHETVYKLRCRELGERHPDTLDSLNNLAVSCGLTGQLKKALELQKKAYELRIEALGEMHPDTLNSLDGLAVLYEDLGRKQKAVKPREKLYAQRCKVFGERHPATLKALDALGSLYGKMGRTEEMVEIKEKVYCMRSELLGKENPDTLQSLRSLAVANFNNGDYAKALSLAQQYYESLCRLKGTNHPDVIQAKADMEQIRTYL